MTHEREKASENNYKKSRYTCVIESLSVKKMQLNYASHMRCAFMAPRINGFVARYIGKIKCWGVRKMFAKELILMFV